MKVNVAVFEDVRKRSIRLNAYTMYYNREWSGCCMHCVEIEKRTDAKKAAIKEHKEFCMNPDYYRQHPELMGD